MITETMQKPMIQLCEACERRMHLWRAGVEKNSALCPGCSWRLNDWLAQPANAWVRDQLSKERP